MDGGISGECKKNRIKYDSIGVFVTKTMQIQMTVVLA